MNRIPVTTRDGPDEHLPIYEIAMIWGGVSRIDYLGSIHGIFRSVSASGSDLVYYEYTQQSVVGRRGRYRSDYRGIAVTSLAGVAEHDGIERGMALHMSEHCIERA